MKYFIFLSLILSFLAPELAIAKGGLRHKLYCRMRRSSDCKKLEVFRLDYKDGCAEIGSRCRRKFCKHNCAKGFGPHLEETVKACQTYCDPQDLKDTTREERKFFRDNFENKNSRRRREVSDFIANILSTQIWCESECDYDEKSPSCRVKGKVNHHWKTCASKCFFIKDIKEHAEGCLQKLSLAPKPARRKK